jgi:hypothetical protein
MRIAASFAGIGEAGERLGRQHARWRNEADAGTDREARIGGTGRNGANDEREDESVSAERRDGARIHHCQP